MRKPGSTRIKDLSTAYEAQKRLESLVRGIVELPSARGRTHADILERLNSEVYSNPLWKRVPQHVREYLSGYISACWRSHYSILEWMIPWRGLMLTKEESDAWIPSGDWSNTGEGGGHYWRKFQGTPKGWLGPLVRY